MGQRESEDAALIGAMWPVTEEYQQPLGTGSDRNRFVPRASRRSVDFPTPHFFFCPKTLIMDKRE